ncbi:MAG: hypothetical protein GWN93_15115, partial [Deltaproteobacteria bacterium]|nr:hypothetical protein [Deltaproteobacteria bacterium]
MSEYSAGATAVVREASNGSNFLDLVQRETGLGVRVLSGTEEARLSLLGVSSVITNKESAMVVFDIGGGSTELVWQGDSSDIESFSLAVGVVHLTETFLQGDPPGHEPCLQVREYVSTVLRELSFHQNSHDSLWVGTAGTVTTLASMWYEMAEYDPEKINGTVLERAW